MLAVLIPILAPWVDHASIVPFTPADALSIIKFYQKEDKTVYTFHPFFSDWSQSHFHQALKLIPPSIPVESLPTWLANHPWANNVVSNTRVAFSTVVSVLPIPHPWDTRASSSNCVCDPFSQFLVLSLVFILILFR